MRLKVKLPPPVIKNITGIVIKTKSPKITAFENIVNPNKDQKCLAPIFHPSLRVNFFLPVNFCVEPIIAPRERIDKQIKTKLKTRTAKNIPQNMLIKRGEASYIFSIWLISRKCHQFSPPKSRSP